MIEQRKKQRKNKQSQMKAASFPPKSTIDIDVRYRPSIQVSAKKSTHEPFCSLLQIARSDQRKHHDYTLFLKFPRFASPSPVVFLLLFFLSMRFPAQLEFPRADEEEEEKEAKARRTKSANVVDKEAPDLPCGNR